MDMSPWAVETYNLNHHGQAFVGDVHNSLHIIHMAESIGFQSMGMLMGFPCPPFSTRGDQLGFADERALTFIAGLDAAYLLNCSFVILECTPKVESFSEVVQSLDSFARAMGFRWSSQILHLDESWPVRRTRWWCVLCPPDIRKCLVLSDLPSAPHLQTIRDIFPVWPRWTLEGEEPLAWDLDEQQFHLRFATVDQLLLNTCDKCPTLLHSMGHLDRACPCGCRPCGLSSVRLSKDGISAIAVQCSHSAGLRHLHPQEAGYLCTLPPNFRYSKLRESLPLIGQTAAPLQSHWILLAFKQAVSRYVQADPIAESLVWHEAFVHNLRTLAEHCLPNAATAVEHVVRFSFGASHVIALSVHPNCTIEQFIADQLTKGGWGEQISVLYEHDVVPFGALLQSGTYHVVEVDPTVCAAPSIRSSTYLVEFAGRVWFGTFVPGLTLAGLLLKLGLPTYLRLVFLTDHGPLLPQDLLPSTVVGKFSRPALSGAGPLPSCGLTEFQIEAEAARLLRSCRPPIGFLLLPTLDLSELLLLPDHLAEQALTAMIPPGTFRVFGIFCSEGHWAAFSVDVIAGVCTYYDGCDNMLEAGRFLIDTVVMHLDLRIFLRRRFTLLSQTDGSHCGVIALINLGWFLGLWTSYSEPEALTWYARLCAPRFLGRGQVEYTQVHTQLVEELPKHGVPNKDAASRAAHAIKKLGLGAIAKALSAKHPWQALKALGNSQDKPLPPASRAGTTCSRSCCLQNRCYAQVEQEGSPA
eukprot:Skav211479  [mRNA]  locus=scaffold2188:30360:32612:- [translate_table: standard]